MVRPSTPEKQILFCAQPALTSEAVTSFWPFSDWFVRESPMMMTDPVRGLAGVVGTDAWAVTRRDPEAPADGAAVDGAAEVAGTDVALGTVEAEGADSDDPHAASGISPAMARADTERRRVMGSPTPQAVASPERRRARRLAQRSNQHTATPLLTRPTMP